MEEPTSLSLKGIKWHYKGEGNSNLVISLSKLKMIARLYKIEDGCSKKKIDFEKARREVLFWRKILIPHLGKHFEPPFLAFLSEEDAGAINRVLRVHRPQHRLNKSIRSGLITIYPDFTFLPSSNLFEIDEEMKEVDANSLVEVDETTFCVEIKPKQGWTYPSDRQRKCTFCLNQFLKLESGRVSNISGYCPLDLFSGNKSRMKQALKNLLLNPQNNLKIFQDGYIVYSDSSNCVYQDIVRRWFQCDKLELENTERLVDKWTELIYTALTRDMSSENCKELFDISHMNSTNSSGCNTSPSIFSTLTPCDWSSEQLPSNCILNRILLLQKLQDTDFKTVYKHFKHLERYTDDYQYVNNLLESDRVELGALARYLLAATSKDCSVLIAFRRVQCSLQPGSSYVSDMDGISYETSVGVLDLDPKPLSCIAKHYNRDLNVHSAYLKYISKNEPLKNIINKIKF